MFELDGSGATLTSAGCRRNIHTGGLQYEQSFVVVYSTVQVYMLEGER
jgi:hypothetical protein